MTKKQILIVLLAFVCVVAVFATTLFVTMVNNKKEEEKAARATAQSELQPLEPTEQKPKEYDYHVCIETGHGIDAQGKWDTGCTWNGYEEAKLMIPITQAMSDYLTAHNVDVYTDAFSENDRNLDVTLDYLDTHEEIDAFVNVHCDYGNAASGTMPLYNTDEQKKLAECLNQAVHEAIDIPDRGLQYRTDLETLCNPKVHCTSCLFETGSISSDNEILTNQAKAYGEALAKGLLNYLNQQHTAQ